MLQLISLVSAVLATSQPHFEPVQGEPASPAAAVPGPRPTAGMLVRTDIAGLTASLEAAPDFNRFASLGEYGAVIALPHPAGGTLECVVAESPVMEAALQARHPNVRTYLVRSLDGTATGRLEFAPRGLTAMLRTPDGTWMIDLWQSADPEHVVAYWMHDLPNTVDYACETVGGVGVGAGAGFGGAHLDAAEPDAGGFGERTIQNLRTVRLAVACTGEYGVYHSQIQGRPPNIADPLAAIVTVVARTNVIYEQDLAVHFNLVENNDRVIFIDPATDPYNASCGGDGGTDCSGPLLGANITTLNSIIGFANYDVGEVLTRIFGGVANLRAVCGTNKGGGVSGLPRGGDIDPFAANVLIHELGHQFGANHTFSGVRGRCGNNANITTAWEAGSGSSPMAYAGACPVGDAPPSDNVVRFADNYFHNGSFGEMSAFLNAPTTTCPVLTPSGNTIPTLVSTTPNTPIPPATPFTLTAAASDPDGDTLTYSWEQHDNGVARPLLGPGSGDNGMGALFRIFPPTISPARTFPRFADLLSGEITRGERLPTVAGVQRRFRVMVRDNHPGAGGVVVSPNIFISIVGTPFSVTSPGASSRLSSGLNPVNWTVGGTAGTPIFAATVTISLSTDGGATFNSLGSFPNTGSATVNIPTVPPGEGFIRINANNRIFFALSREFLINVPCTADADHDGDVDSDDIVAFFADFDAGDADLDGDSDTDSDDVVTFFEGFESGCGT